MTRTHSEELEQLVAEVARYYAPTPQRKAENDTELESVRMAVVARRADLEGRTKD